MVYNRRHVRYYGGYHGQHRVIVWLWEVVKNDLNREEKAAFLKVCIYNSGYFMYCTAQKFYTEFNSLVSHSVGEL